MAAHLERHASRCHTPPPGVYARAPHQGQGPAVQSSDEDATDQVYLERLLSCYAPAKVIHHLSVGRGLTPLRFIAFSYPHSESGMGEGDKRRLIHHIPC